MEKRVRVMTIASNDSGDFTILSSGLPGSVQENQNQIAFIREALAYLEKDAEKQRETTEKLRSQFEVD